VSGSLVVHDKDVNNVQVPLLQHASERWIALQHVSVRVDRLKRGKRLSCGGLPGGGSELSRTADSGKGGAYGGPKQLPQLTGR
jgi:hypothetical protein